MASADPGIATIEPERLKRVKDLQPDALAQRREIEFARRLAVTTQARPRELRQIRLACGHPAAVTGLTQARSGERCQVATSTAAPKRRTRLCASNVLRDRLAAVLALGVAGPAQPLAPPRRPLVTRGAAHQTQRLLRLGTKEEMLHRMKMESSLFADRLSSPEVKEAITAFFEKRKPSPSA